MNELETATQTWLTAEQKRIESDRKATKWTVQRQKDRYEAQRAWSELQNIRRDIGLPLVV